MIVIPAFAGMVWLAISGYDNWNHFDRATSEKLKYKNQNVIVLIPRLTEAAYSDHGFYWYYDGRCGTECLTINVNAMGEQARYGSYNYNTVKILRELGYPMMTDLFLYHQLKINPDYLSRFDHIILLHNEYVTKEMFEAITNHDSVIYLHPNSLYAEVNITNNMMTLVRGHGYPTSDIDNGFDWMHDNTRPDEFDHKCESWQFRRISNGFQLNCYPEIVLTQKPEILAKLKELIQK